MPMEPKLTLPWNKSRSTKGHDLYKLCSTTDPNDTCQVSRQLAQWFWKRFFKLSFPLPKEAPHKIWLIGQAVLEEKTFEKCGRTDDGPWVYYKLTLWAWRLRWANKAKWKCMLYEANTGWKKKKVTIVSWSRSHDQDSHHAKICSKS